MTIRQRLRRWLRRFVVAQTRVAERMDRFLGVDP